MTRSQVTFRFPHGAQNGHTEKIAPRTLVVILTRCLRLLNSPGSWSRPRELDIGVLVVRQIEERRNYRSINFTPLTLVD